MGRQAFHMQPHKRRETPAARMLGLMSLSAAYRVQDVARDMRVSFSYASHLLQDAHREKRVTRTRGSRGRWIYVRVRVREGDR